jgi:hypothetical protein
MFSQRLKVGGEPSGQAQFLVGDDLQQGIVAQAVGVIGVFIAGHDLIETLPQQGPGAMLRALRVAGIGQPRRLVAGQMMALIESTQRQQASVTGDLAAGKICADSLMTVEGETQLWVEHFVSSDGCSERECWVAETQCSSPF